MQILAFPAKRKKPILKVESNRARIFFFSQIGSISLKTRKASFDEKKKREKRGRGGGEGIFTQRDSDVDNDKRQRKLVMARPSRIFMRRDAFIIRLK